MTNINEVEISIGKSSYKISCQESEKEKLLELSKLLNQKVNKLSLALKSDDEKLLLVILALQIQEKLLQKDESDDEDETRLNDQDMYDAVSDNIENVTNYIEKLTKKIQHY